MFPLPGLRPWGTSSPGGCASPYSLEEIRRNKSDAWVFQASCSVQGWGGGERLPRAISYRENSKKRNYQFSLLKTTPT